MAEARTRHQELGDDAHHAHATRHVATCQFLCGQSQVATELLRTCSAPAPGTGGDWDLAESLEILSPIKAAAGHLWAAMLPPQRQPYAGGPAPSRAGSTALAEPYLALARAGRNAWDPGWQAGTHMSSTTCSSCPPTLELDHGADRPPRCAGADEPARPKKTVRAAALAALCNRPTAASSRDISRRGD